MCFTIGQGAGSCFRVALRAPVFTIREVIGAQIVLIAIEHCLKESSNALGEVNTGILLSSNAGAKISMKSKRVHTKAMSHIAIHIVLIGYAIVQQNVAHVQGAANN